MNHSELKTAITEAERFLARARALDAKHRQDHPGQRADPVMKLATGGAPLPEGLYTHPKHQGAVRRASMDLTRALAELRKGKRR